MWKYASAVATGAAREIGCFGTRGDGKTFGFLWATILHAVEHLKAGYPIPVRWMGVTDTFRSHTLKTIRTLEHPAWGGKWHLRDDKHLAVYVDQGLELVALDLFGVEDVGAFNRLRMETCGVWFEEPAPVLGESSGISLLAWSVAMSSQRMPTHAHVATFTANYPESGDWTWQRFVEEPVGGTMYFEIPAGERRDAKQTEDLRRAYANNPALFARLVGGEPAFITLGEAVLADLWDATRHVGSQERKPHPDETLVLGHDGGLTPCTTIGQRLGGRAILYAGLVTKRGGTRQHLEQTVVPWLSLHAPWTLRGKGSELLHHRYDPSMDTPDQSDLETSPMRVITSILGGSILPGPVSWDGRIEPFKAVLDKTRNIVEVVPGADTRELRMAFAGKWHYPSDPVTGKIRRDLPVKDHPWSDLGDTACYVIEALAPLRKMDAKQQKYARSGTSDVFGDKRARSSLSRW